MVTTSSEGGGGGGFSRFSQWAGRVRCPGGPGGTRDSSFHARGCHELLACLLPHLLAMSAGSLPRVFHRQKNLSLLGSPGTGPQEAQDPETKASCWCKSVLCIAATGTSGPSTPLVWSCRPTVQMVNWNSPLTYSSNGRDLQLEGSDHESCFASLVVNEDANLVTAMSVDTDPLLDKCLQH